MENNNIEKKSSWKNWIIKKLLSSETTREEVLNFIATNDSDADIDELEDLEINSAKLNIDMTKEEVKNIVSLSSFMANGSGARGTPTFFINEEFVVGYISIDQIKSLLK